MKKIEDEIQEMVDRETRTWDTQDAELLVSIFHMEAHHAHGLIELRSTRY